MDYQNNISSKEKVRDQFLSVVMPAYNEEKTLSQIVHQVLQLPQLLELVIIDDCSNDNTEEIAQNLAKQDFRIKYVRQAKNGGKTEALKTGFALTEGEIVIIQDADLELNPAEIPKVIAPIVDGRASVSYGSRFLVKGTQSALYFRHHIANKALTFFSNCLSNLNLTDVETCYKAFRGDIIRQMIITSKGFGFEIEATAKIAKLKCSVYEVPITYNKRTYEEGKKIGLSDGIAALWYIVKFNLLNGFDNSFVKAPKFSRINFTEDIIQQELS